MPLQSLLSELQSLETELHHPGIHCLHARLEQLLHPDFHEVGRSGQPYNRETVLNFLHSLSVRPTVESTDFNVALLGDGIALLTFRSTQYEPDGTPVNRALRASIWIQTATGWQLRYHQGTPTEL